MSGYGRMVAPPGPELAWAALGYGWRLFEMGALASGVIAQRSMMMAQALATGKLGDPEFVQMVTEKALAANEAYWHAARHLVRAEAYDLSRAASGGLALAEACLRPYRRKVRANARRLGNRG